MAIPLFVNPSDTVTVNFVVGVAKDNPKQVYCDVDEATLLDIYPNVDKDTIEKHEAVFRLPNFEDQSKMVRDGFKLTDDGVNTNPAAMQLGRIMRLLKSWTLTKNATTDEIKNLNPLVALVISSELERKIG